MTTRESRDKVLQTLSDYESMLVNNSDGYEGYKQVCVAEINETRKIVKDIFYRMEGLEK